MYTHRNGSPQKSKNESCVRKMSDLLDIKQISRTETKNKRKDEVNKSTSSQIDTTIFYQLLPRH